jgi:hypothetical protein
MSEVKEYKIRPYYNYVPTGKKPRPIMYIETETGCWQCTSHAPNQDGYPKLGRGGKTCLLFKEVYKDFYRVDLKPYALLRHKCDNRICINPEHLQTGTPADNSADMVKRGRSLKGTKSHNAKLTEEQVSLIKNHLTEYDGLRIARFFGVHSNVIYRIRKGVGWTHVQ